MRPAVGGKSPVIALKSVVLPAPFEPSTAYFWPAATVIDTSSTARSAPNARVTFVSVNASLDAEAERTLAPARGAVRRRGMARVAIAQRALDPTPSPLPSPASGRGRRRCRLDPGACRNEAVLLPLPRVRGRGLG